jgi:hypothetical protein
VARLGAGKAKGGAFRPGLVRMRVPAADWHPRAATQCRRGQVFCCWHREGQGRRIELGSSYGKTKTWLHGARLCEPVALPRHARELRHPGSRRPVATVVNK